MSQIPWQLAGCKIDKVTITEHQIIIEARTKRPKQVCPDCEMPSTHYHSSHIRHIQDLPISTREVRVALRVKRFRCSNQDCPRKTFTETLRDIEPYSRRTNRTKEVLWHVGQVAGGQAGARLSRHLKMPISRHSLLRLLRRQTPPTVAPPRVIGLDDWAKRKGQSYGTIIVDLEQHCVVELLDTRDEETVSTWLKTQPQIEIVASDRAKEYARGIRSGAPQAIQVADRWHLLKNLSDALTNTIIEWRSRSNTAKQASAIARETFPRSRTDQARRKQAYEKRLKRWLLVKQLKARGLSSRRIARLTRLSRTTVLRYLKEDHFPERQPSPRPSILDPYLPYLKQRVAEADISARQLWREIQEQGYPGSASQVRKWKQSYDPDTDIDTRGESPTTPLVFPSLGVCFRLLSFLPEWLPPDEQVLLKHLLQNQDFALLHHLAQSLGTIIRERNDKELDSWLRDANNSPFPALQRFAMSLEHDYEAVRAALHYGWSNGPTEGTIHKLKLLKRQMYGRAKLDLLRLRLLYSDP